MHIRRQIVLLLEALIKHKRYYCSICGNESFFFLNAGNRKVRFNGKKVVDIGFRRAVRCPYCNSIDRFRWTDYCFEHFTNLYNEKNDVLHIAPEKYLSEKIRKVSGKNYISGDVEKGKADIIVDLTKMSFQDGKFDWIIINHVLEHIENEMKAMSEIYRCLKTNGHVFFSMPIALDSKTHETKKQMSPDDRLREYGQQDHVRLYGRDTIKRIEKYGFKVEKYRVGDYLSDECISRYGLSKDTMIFIGAKK